MESNTPKEKAAGYEPATYKKDQAEFINNGGGIEYKRKKRIELLNYFDSEIMGLRNNIDPSTKSYRYDSVRLDILCLQRDVTESQEIAEMLESELATQKQKLKILELKTGIMEMVVTQLCRPESRDFLTSRIAQDVCKHWQSMQGDTK